MTHTNAIFLDRRDFLRGASAVAVTALLGVPSFAEASADHTEHRATSLAFWNGSQFICPSTLTDSNYTLSATGAKVTIHGHFVPNGITHPSFHSATVHYKVDVKGQATELPFYAWTACKTGSCSSAFHVPLGNGRDLSFAIKVNSSHAAEESYRLSPHPSQMTEKLHLGTYVIASGNPSWRGCRLIETETGMALVRTTAAGDVPVEFEHLLLTVRHSV